MCEFARRLVFFENPALLPVDVRTALERWRKERLLTTEKVKWTTVPRALEDVEKRLKTVNEEDRAYLLEMRSFFEEVAVCPV